MIDEVQNRSTSECYTPEPFINYYPFVSGNKIVSFQYSEWHFSVINMQTACNIVACFGGVLSLLRNGKWSTLPWLCSTLRQYYALLERLLLRGCCGMATKNRMDVPSIEPAKCYVGRTWREESEDKVKVILRTTDIRPVRPDVRPPSGKRDKFFFQFLGIYLDIHCFSMWCASLTRGLVGNLCLLLSFTSALCLGSESRRTRDHTLLSEL
jgi:hypothetical protein